MTLALALLLLGPVEDALATAPRGTRVAMVVADETGREIVAIRPDERVVPASNAKIATSVAVMATLDTAAPDGDGGATVALEGDDVVLAGHGDARLSSAADCTTDCLADLARAVARRTRRVRDVIGDDGAFPDERWPAGMSWNNMATRYGTAVSALTLDNNVTTLTVIADATAARAVGDGYYRLASTVTVTQGGAPAIAVERTPGSDLVRLVGTLPAGTTQTLTIGLDDPAHRAAWRFAALLRAAGVRVTGAVRARHAPAGPTNAPVLAALIPPPLREDVTVTMKESQNLHAELLLRRLAPSGLVKDAHAVVAGVLASAGVAPWQVELADGSGMSNYDRVTPRALVRLLRWTTTQSWGPAWRATLPVGGVDGTLARRFAGTPLAGRLFAKTGSLAGVNALSGFVVAASGRTLTFSAIANDVPGDASATPALDAAVLAVAAAN